LAIDSREIIDNEGTKLSSLRQARTEVTKLAGEILRDEGDRFWDGTEWLMDVTDASGQPVIKFRFTADEQRHST
jgi:hypothetical protein